MSVSSIDHPLVLADDIEATRDFYCSVLGLSDCARPRLALLKRRIEEASRYVPIEQLCLSPQCGFSSTVESKAPTADEQRAQLELLVETAAEVWD